MNKIIQSIFKNKKANDEKLLNYGFNKVGEAFVSNRHVSTVFVEN